MRNRQFVKKNRTHGPFNRDKNKIRPGRLSSLRILSRLGYPRSQSSLNAPPVTGRVQGIHGCPCDSARRRRFVEKPIERNPALTPGDDPVGEGVGRGRQCGFSVQSKFLSRSGQRRQGVVSVAAGVGNGKSVELALGNFEHAADLLEEAGYFALGTARKSSVESQRRESTTASRCGTRHGSCAASGR